MIRAVRRLALLLAPIVALAAPASSEELRLRFEARWIGLEAGTAALSLSEVDGRYAAHAEIRAAGLPRLFTGFRAAADSEGVFNSEDGPQPGVRYAADYRLRGRDKRTRFAYDAAGDAALPARSAGDSSDRDELPAAERLDAYDPLAALVAFRARLRAGAIVVGEPFRFAVYDGRRRFDVEGVLGPAGSDPATGARVRVAELTLRPRAGFAARDRAAIDEAIDGEPRPARLVLSADALALPLEFETQAAGFPLEVRLTEACGGFGCVRPPAPGG